MGQLKNKHTKPSLGPDQSRILGGWVVYLGLLMSIMLIVPFGLAHGAYIHRRIALNATSIHKAEMRYGETSM